MASSIKVGNDDVTSIKVDNSNVKLVTVGDTAIWQNFNPSFTRKITSTANNAVTEWTRLADNATAFQIYSDCKNTLKSCSATIWIRLYLTPSLYYDFSHHTYDNGFFASPETRLIIYKNGTELYRTTVLSGQALSGGGISYSACWGNAGNDDFSVGCSIWDVGYFDKDNPANKKLYYTGSYPLLYYGCMPGDNANNISYYINTSSFK